MIEKMETFVEYDLYCTDNWSLAPAPRIILMTLVKGFTGKSAY